MSAESNLGRDLLPHELLFTGRPGDNPLELGAQGMEILMPSEGVLVSVRLQDPYGGQVSVTHYGAGKDGVGIAFPEDVNEGVDGHRDGVVRLRPLFGFTAVLTYHGAPTRRPRSGAGYSAAAANSDIHQLLGSTLVISQPSIDANPAPAPMQLTSTTQHGLVEAHRVAGDFEQLEDILVIAAEALLLPDADSQAMVAIIMKRVHDAKQMLNQHRMSRGGSLRAVIAQAAKAENEPDEGL